MRHISTIDVTKRCRYDPKKDKLMDFLEEITDKDFQKRMKEVINWKNLESPPMKQAGLEAEKHYAPYLKSKIKDMKKIVLLLFSIISLTSCNKPILQDIVLSGNHELRKFNIKTSTETTTSAWFFICGGSYDSKTKESAKIRFYFLNYKHEYQLFECDFDLVNIKIDNSVKTPYITFDYRRENGWHNEKDLYDMHFYDPIIKGVVLCCKDSDFQPEININDLK